MLKKNRIYLFKDDGIVVEAIWMNKNLKLSVLMVSLLHWNAHWDHCMHPLQMYFIDYFSLFFNTLAQYIKIIDNSIIFRVVTYLMHQNVSGQSSPAINQIMLDIDGYFKINFCFMHRSAVFLLFPTSTAIVEDSQQLSKAIEIRFNLSQYLIRALFELIK